MRMLMIVKMPNTDFNDGVKNGSVGKVLERILEDCAAEAVYFTEVEGFRGAMMVVNVDIFRAWQSHGS
jgi:hypothetical protein